MDGLPPDQPAPDSSGNWQRSMALLAAVDAGDVPGVVQLLAAGADPDVVEERNDPTPLMTAAENGQLELVRVLVAGGANVSATAEDLGLDRLLGALGADPAVTDAVGTLVWPLLYADLAGHRAVVDYLAPRTDPALRRDLDQIHLILRRFRKPIRDRRTKSLLAAVEADQLDEVNRLLAAGVPVNSQDKAGSSALMYAVALDRPPLIDALLAAGADPTLETNERMTPLHATKSPAIARLLVQAGAAINARNRSQSTPLIFAARRGSVELVQTLLTLGASVDLTDVLGETALTNAVSQRNTAVFAPLLAAGADPMRLDHYGRTIWDVADLNKVGEPLRAAWRLVHQADPPA